MFCISVLRRLIQDIHSAFWRASCRLSGSVCVTLSIYLYSWHNILSKNVLEGRAWLNHGSSQWHPAMHILLVVQASYYSFFEVLISHTLYMKHNDKQSQCAELCQEALPKCSKAIHSLSGNINVIQPRKCTKAHEVRNKNRAFLKKYIRMQSKMSIRTHTAGSSRHSIKELAQKQSKLWQRPKSSTLKVFC